MAIDFKPDQNEYGNLSPFKTWLKYQINTWGFNNFPFLENDFDQLTEYGMMMKLMKSMYQVIENQNLVEDDMNKLYTAYTELQTYVDNAINEFETSVNNQVQSLEDFMNNYFANLDVQEEINNKLDEYLDDGTLEHIIASYLQTQKIYNTHAEMVADTTNLVDGLTVQTLGYSNINDGGGAFYKMTSTEPSGTYYETLGENLYALLIKNSEYLDVRQLGILPNTATIQSVPLYNAFLTANQMGLITYIPKGTYIVKGNEIITDTTDSLSSRALIIPENSNVYFEKDAIIKLIDDAIAWTRVVSPLSNVTIHGEITIDGSSDSITAGNEHMAGLFISNVNNVYIESLKSYNCYGDNVQITGDTETNTIIIDNLYCRKAGRKNLVFENGNNVHIHNAYLDNTEGGANLQWQGSNSLDVEPFDKTSYKSLTIDRIETFGNGNDVTSGTTYEQIKNCHLYFGTFIQHGGEFLSYGILANVDNLIFYNGKLSISYQANWNINNLIFYKQEKDCLSIAGNSNQSPNVNINNLKIYASGNTYNNPAIDIRSVNCHIGNVYAENYLERLFYFYGSITTDITKTNIDNITCLNCGFNGTADTNAIIVTGRLSGRFHKVYINTITVNDTREENKPTSIIKYLTESENVNFYANNVINNTSYVTVNTRYSGYKPVLGQGGNDTQRPTHPYVGIIYYDTTLNKYITHDGTNWVNMDGSSLS